MTEIFHYVASGSLIAGHPKTRQINWLAEHFPSAEEQRDYAREKCIEAVTATLDRALESANLSQVALAEKLGKSKGQVSRILSGAHNMTLRTLGDVLWACNLEVVNFDAAVGPLGVIEVPVDEEEWWTEIMGGYPPSRASPQPPDQTLVLFMPSTSGSTAYATSKTINGYH